MSIEKVWADEVLTTLGICAFSHHQAGLQSYSGDQLACFIVCVNGYKHTAQQNIYRTQSLLPTYIIHMVIEKDKRKI